ncbi:MAG TPA: 4-aminobutyrate--2-oxoglutarate transaminase [Verrucomicrobiae bacterium]|jgi:4-aminobutyrate aminotransferase/(S)-3-amino-2-methylpropionate transaminase|nr:4-aminobutyrate--2-oxoglutarate transaminase [Verrucomicrobiae bacterium]
MPTIELRTPIPGPRSRDLARRRVAAVARGVSPATPIFAAHAEGAIVEDVDGNRLLDFAGGIGCVNVGHRAPQVVSAIRDQTDAFLHTCFSVVPYANYVELAEKLNRLIPGDFAKKTILVNTGAEAVENAIKIARSYTRRPAIICFEDAFHGRTMLALSLTSKTHPYKAGFEPFSTDIYRIPYAYCYRCSYSLAYPSCGIFCAHHLEDTFKRVIAAEAVAAIVVEPVLGEGGFVAPPPEFFAVLQDVCRRHHILLIADEVQTGFGRTGTMFASERYGIVPDILVAAKSIAGGLPLASVTGRAEIMDTPGPGGLGGTFGGNPVASAAALAVLEIMERENLPGRAETLGNVFESRARRWRERWPVVGDVRGLGAMRAIELVRSQESREPAKEETAQVLRYCQEHGLILVSAGSYGNVLRLLVPLVITDDQFDEGLSVLEGALESVAGSGLKAVPDRD